MLGSGDLFPPPKTSEQKLEEMKTFSDLFENWALPGLYCLLRWPWWPLWKRTHGGHESLRFSQMGQAGFALLCCAGLCAEIFCVLYLAVEPLYRHAVVHQTDAIWSVAIFAALTVIRIGTWVYTEIFSD